MLVGVTFTGARLLVEWLHRLLWLNGVDVGDMVEIAYGVGGLC